MIGMAWIRKWTPQNAKDKRLSQAQSTRLYILLLVIRDHIESIGKVNTIMGGVRCCLMSFLLEVLSDMLQKPSTTFSYPHMT